MNFIENQLADVNADLFAATISGDFASPSTSCATDNGDTKSDEVPNELGFVDLFNNELVENGASRAA